LIRVYRLNPKKHREKAYSGLVASKSPGRWNLLGTPMVYTSVTESLAFLELFVHLPTITLQSLDWEYESVAAEITCSIYTVNLANLPPNWRDLTSLPRSTQELGTQWMNDLRHLVVSVPSAVFPGERNYLINPKHPDFATHCLAQPEQPIFPDPRILARLA
jgi:RES domain-containing protein